VSVTPNPIEPSTESLPHSLIQRKDQAAIVGVSLAIELQDGSNTRIRYVWRQTRKAKAVHIGLWNCDVIAVIANIIERDNGAAAYRVLYLHVPFQILRILELLSHIIQKRQTTGRIRTEI